MMKRRSFLKLLGIAPAGVASAALAEDGEDFEPIASTGPFDIVAETRRIKLPPAAPGRIITIVNNGDNWIAVE